MPRAKLTAREVAKREKSRKKRESEYQIKLIKEKYKRYEFKVMKERDADIIEHLASIQSVNAYIKELIRKDMERNV